MGAAGMSASAKREQSRQLASLGPAVARLKAIAEQSADALLTEGPVHLDHNLLDLCANALHHLAHAQKAYDARPEWVHLPKAEQQAALATSDWLYDEHKNSEAMGKPYLLNISKLKARTAAGIYAKAMVVRASKTGAAGLAMTLAADLLDCPGLRASLWPPLTEG
jgi:hypothetical protein